MTSKPRRHTVRKATSVVAAIALACGGVSIGAVTAPEPALALNLPTWDDVAAAKANEGAAAKKVAEIEALLEQVRGEVKATQEAAVNATSKAQEAQSKFDSADQRHSQLLTQAAEKEIEAKKASESAATVIAETYRTGGVSPSMELFLDADASTADALLDRLALMSKVTERNTQLSEKAAQVHNTAASLGEQAEAVSKERERLYKIAETERSSAASAADDARQRQLAAEQNQRVLEAQLAALKDKTAKTVSGYQERLRIEEEARRKAEEEARRQAAAAAEAARKAAAAQSAQQQQAVAAQAAQYARQSAAAAAAGQPAPAAPVSGGGGWTYPLAPGTYVTSCPMNCYPGHNGHDMAATPWTPIYAAQSGRVIFSGWESLGGNTVFIDHGNGVHSWYGHMVQAPSVGYGQYVGAGQIIGYVGSTGMATGPHLHFEIRIWGTPYNARDFMAQRGIYFN